MSQASVTSCQQAVFELENEQGRISCAINFQMEQLPLVSELKDLLTEMNIAELTQQANFYVCYIENVELIISMCSIITSADEKRLKTKMVQSLDAINDELNDRDAPPVANPDALPGGGMIWIIVVSALAAVLLIMIAVYTAVRKSNGPVSEELEIISV
jgi:hypothetical protein